MLQSEITTSAGERTEAPAPRRRRRRLVFGGTAVLAVGAAGVLFAVQDGDGSAAKTSSTLPTVPVVRTDMVDTTDVDGTLGYGGALTVLGPGSGRITWLPPTGAEIQRGKRVFGIDGHSVPLFYGSTPFWRELKDGMTKGRDVLELERNLAALGYADGHGDVLTVDRSFTWVTAAAVRAWQKDLGVQQTGTVKVGDVVVQPGGIRVTKVEAILGAPASGTVLTASGTERRISVKLPVSTQGVAREGAKVRVSLPGGKTTTGHISSVGTVATAGTTGAQAQTGEGTQNATVPVQITLDDPKAVGKLDGAPATVGFTGTEHKSVLAVPVNALLASADGSYSVNAVDASGNVRSVPVKLGIFDGDKVEVSGALTPGTKVQVPRT
ncbi:peptidoglycan-binding protein [Actinomadura sp. 1N219]|uniref:peptidoglycan-binding protein n=1 Tax=Actinomadura sp. 1N219 TaxID=3375152 RepID=UPI00378BB902